MKPSSCIRYTTVAKSPTCVKFPAYRPSTYCRMADIKHAIGNTHGRVLQGICRVVMGRIHTGHPPTSGWHIISMRSNSLDIEDGHPFRVPDYQHAVAFAFIQATHMYHEYMTLESQRTGAQQPTVSRQQERLRARTMVWPLLNPNQFTCGHNAQHLKTISGISTKAGFQKRSSGCLKTMACCLMRLLCASSYMHSYCCVLFFFLMLKPLGFV